MKFIIVYEKHFISEKVTCHQKMLRFFFLMKNSFANICEDYNKMNFAFMHPVIKLMNTK